MQYFGGKAKIAKVLVPELQKYISEGQTFVDAFCGSCNVLSRIKATKRIGNDLHKELISLHKAVQSGWIPPSHISEEEYKNAREGGVEDHLKAFIGFGCSFGGKYFGGYARRNKEEYNYAMGSGNSLLKKHKTMKDVIFTSGSYDQISLPDNSVVYCDIPYKDTVGYSVGGFNHEEFYEWAKKAKEDGHTILVSEYEHNVPSGWNIVWRHESKKVIRNKEGVPERTIEILMCPTE